MILGFGILSIAHFWPEILRINVIAKKLEFSLIFWQLSDTKGESLPYDKKMSNHLLIIVKSIDLKKKDFDFIISQNYL